MTAKRSTVLLLELLTAFSLLVGCAGIERPNTDVCIINAPNRNRRCQNMNTDYDDNGKLNPAAKPIYRSNASIQDLNKFLCIDSPTGTTDGQAALKAYLTKLRNRLANCQNGQ